MKLFTNLWQALTTAVEDQIQTIKSTFTKHTQVQTTTRVVNLWGNGAKPGGI